MELVRPDVKKESEIKAVKAVKKDGLILFDLGVSEDYRILNLKVRSPSELLVVLGK